MKALKRIEESDSEGTPVVGVFVPKCDTDGSFAQVQCHASTGKCFCVDSKSGEKIAGIAEPGNPLCMEGEILFLLFFCKENAFLNFFV